MRNKEDLYRILGASNHTEEDREENKDDNHDNDIYDVDMNFTLAFVPGDNDDLLVRITYKDLDGNEINVNDGNTFIQILPINAKVKIKPVLCAVLSTAS